PDQLPQLRQQRRSERQPEARGAASEALAERGELGVKGVDRVRPADRFAELDQPPGRQRLDLRGVPVADHDWREREFVEQRLHRVRWAEPAIGWCSRVATGRAHLDRVDGLVDPPLANRAYG